MRSLRDRVERDHPQVLESAAAKRADHQEAVAAKRAKMADDSGANTAVPHSKRSC